MYQDIVLLRPYFFSLREINENVSLDIKLPATWKYETIVSEFLNIKTKIQDKNEKFNLLSLVATDTKVGYDAIFNCASKIISINKDEEEKRKLFEQKVNELKTLFQNESLINLKDLNFLENYGQQDATSIGMVEEGNRERQDGSGRE